MYIASVFAQLEREVIAERIRDNMIELAKTGRWLGGMTPTGYESTSYDVVKVVDNETGETKTKEVHKLQQVESEGKVIQLIWRKYLELKSFKKVDEYLLEKHICTKNGVPYTVGSIRDIIINPVYAINDKDIYNYFKKNSIEVFNSIEIESFDGEHGMMGYGKNNLLNTKPGRKKPISEWIIAIGEHKGYISGKDWIKAQKIKEGNCDIRNRTPARNKSILSGIYKCECCGDYMRPKVRTGRFTSSGKESFFYLCRMKDRSKRKRCNGENTNGVLLDELVIKEIKKLITPNNKIYNALKQMTIANNEEDNVEYELQNLKDQYNKNQQEIKNLIEKIKYIDISFMEEINKEIVRLRNVNIKLEKEMQIAENETNTNKGEMQKSDIATMVLDIMGNYINVFEELDIAKQRALLKLLIENMTGNGNKVVIDLLNTNLNEEQKQLLPLMCDTEVSTDTLKKTSFALNVPLHKHSNSSA